MVLFMATLILYSGPLVSKVSKEQRDSTTHIPSALSNDGVVSTTGKLTLAAFLGGALVKYGSLYSDLPFNPSPVAAVLIVLSPPVGFCIWAALQDDSTDDLS